MQPVPVFDWTHCKSLFPKRIQNCLLQFVLTAPGPATGHTREKSLALSPLLSDIPPSLLFSKMKVSIIPNVRCTHPSIIFVALCWTCSSMFMSIMLVSQGLHPPLQMWPHLRWAERKDHLLWPAGNAFPKADQFGKILEFSCTVVVKTTLTGFRKRTWAWNCLTYYASKLLIILLFISKTLLK